VLNDRARSLRVREREDADDAFIARLSALAFGEYARGAGESTLHLAHAHRTFIAELSGRAVALAVVRGFGQRRAELLAIAVDESARGIGVGRTLLAHVEGALARAGSNELTLHTAEVNSSALDLFVKRGFTSEQRLPRFYRGVYAAWAMRKRIA